MFNLLSYIIYPWRLIGVFWRLIKHYWWIILILIYIFRGFLISGYIIHTIIKQCEQAGWETSIHSLNGSYFFGFQFNDIHLKNENNSIDLKSLSVSYNIFSPLTGHKILKHIIIDTPNIHYTEDNEDTEHKENKNSQSLAARLENIDLRPIWKNMPLIKIINGTLQYNNGINKFSMTGFNFDSSTAGGKICFDELVAENIEDDTDQKFTNFELGWDLQEDKCIIHTARIGIDGLSNNVHVPEPLVLDISSPRINLGHFKIPLTKGCFLEGNFDQEQAFISLENFCINLQTIENFTPIFKEKFSIPCYLRTDVRLDCKNWDLSKLTGKIRCNLGNLDKLSKLPPLQHANDELECEVDIDDISIFSNVVKKIAPNFPCQFLKGSISLIINSQIEEQVDCKIHCEAKKLFLPYVTSTEAMLDCKLSSSLDGKNIHLESLVISMDSLKCILNGKNTIKKNYISGEIQAIIENKDFSFLSPSLCDNTWNATTKQEWNCTYHYNIKKPSEMSAQIYCNMEIVNAYFQKITLPNLSLSGKFSITPKLWEIQSCLIENILDIKGNGGFSLNDSINISGHLYLEKILPYTTPYFTSNAEWQPKNGKISFSLQGTISQWTAITRIDIIGKQNAPYKSFTLLVSCDGTPKILQVQSASLLWDKKKILSFQCKYNYNTINLSTEVRLQQVANYLEKMNILNNPFFQTNLQTKLHAKGNIEKGIAQIILSLNQLSIQNESLSDVTIKTKTEWNNKNILCNANINYGNIAHTTIQSTVSLTENYAYNCNVKTIISKVNQLPFCNTIGGNFTADIQSKGEILGTNNKEATLQVEWKDAKLDAITCPKIKTQAIILYQPEQNEIAIKNLNILCDKGSNIHNILLDKIEVHSNLSYNLTQQKLNITELLCNCEPGTQLENIPQLEHITLSNVRINTALSFDLKNTNLDIHHFNMILSKGTKINNSILEELELKIIGMFNLIQQTASIKEIELNLNQKNLCALKGNIEKEKISLDFHCVLHDTFAFILKVMNQKPYKLLGSWLLQCNINATKHEDIWKAHLLFNAPCQFDKNNVFEIQWDQIHMQGMSNNGIFAEFDIEYNPTLTKESFPILLFGNTHINIARINIKNQELSLRDISFKCDIQNNELQANIYGLVGGAPLSIDIHANMNKIDIAIKGNDILVIRNNFITMRIDIDLQINANQNNKIWDCTVAGNIIVSTCNINIAFSLDDLRNNNNTEQEEIVLGWEIPNLNVHFDVSINVPNIHIENSLVNLDTKGTIYIKETLAHPEITGKFISKYGKLFLPQGVMTIQECLVNIIPEDPLNVELSLRAETRVQNYRVFVIIEKHKEYFSLEFTSMPPLPQEDIISLLLTGATRTELQEGADEKLKETGSFILMQQLLNYIGIGAYVSAQITETKATITITPPQWHGFAIRTIAEQGGKVGIQFLYRIEFGSQKK